MRVGYATIKMDLILDRICIAFINFILEKEFHREEDKN